MTKPKIVERKLSRTFAGKASAKNNTIELDPRITKHGGNKGYMDTVIHEAVHLIDWEMHEDDVKELSRKLTDVLWKAGYRKVYL